MSKVLVTRVVFDNRTRQWSAVGSVSVNTNDVIRVDQQKAHYAGLIYKVIFRTGAYIFTDRVGASAIYQYM